VQGAEKIFSLKRGRKKVSVRREKAETKGQQGHTMTNEDNRGYKPDPLPAKEGVGD